MYEFEYEVFEFLDMFQKEVPSKIFVIENEDSLSFYYTEAGVIFSSIITFEQIVNHMRMEYGIENDDINHVVLLFKETYLNDITTPTNIKKDNDEIGKEEENKIINVNVHIAEKLKDVKFILY